MGCGLIGTDSMGWAIGSAAGLAGKGYVPVVIDRTYVIFPVMHFLAKHFQQVVTIPGKLRALQNSLNERIYVLVLAILYSGWVSYISVSYTHLTLPTIYSV